MVLAVAAIDFGTTYSGWAYSFSYEFRRDPLKVSTKQWSGGQLVSLKAPTCVLIDPKGEKVEAFGYEAETKYGLLIAESQHHSYYFFQRFKMMLYGKLDVEKDVALQDITKKTLPAKKVFSLTIKYLVDDFKKMFVDQMFGEALQSDDVHWVLTVPAIWSDVAKQFMREAAQDAGIPEHCLSIALEPEAAAFYCLYLPVEKNKESLSTLSVGSKYLVLDCGGGTVDITVHEIQSGGKIKELQKASGGDWGGTKVDDAFEAFMGKVFGEDTYHKFKEENLEDYIDLLRDFEIKKRKVNIKQQDDLVTLHFPASFREVVKETKHMDANSVVAKSTYADKVFIVKDKMRVKTSLLVDLFQEQCDIITKHVTELLKTSELSGCKTIVMVGGFSESPVLQERVKDAFKYQCVSTIIPQEPGLAVLKGAVIFGHRPTWITERVLRHTYGTARLFEVFDIHARIGQVVKVNEETPELIRHPVFPWQPEVCIRVYTSESENPSLVLEANCHRIGELTIPNPDRLSGNDEDRAIGISFLFGGTEIVVKVVTKKTGKVDKIHIRSSQ